MKTNYYNFKVGEEVILNDSIIVDGILHEKGETFTIKDFPPCVTPYKYNYFVFGYNKTRQIIRCDINEIVKL